MKAHELYAVNEDTTNTLIYFTLDSSRREPATKRFQYMLSAAKFTDDERISSECCDLANDLMDVEQIVQRYVAILRTAYAVELAENDGWAYVLDALEDQPFETKLDLINAMALFTTRYEQRISECFRQAYKEVRQFNQRFETFLFKLRTRHYDGSNRDAVLAFAEEEKAEARRAASAPAAPDDSTPKPSNPIRAA